MRLCFQMLQHLEFIAQGQSGMLRLTLQKFIIESAAVTDPMAFRIKGKAGHQHQRMGISSDRTIGDRLRNSC